MKNIYDALIMGVYSVAGLSWLFTIYELITMHLLKSLAFKYGLPILKFSESISVDNTTFEIGKSYLTRSGKFKFINQQECLFCHKYWTMFCTPFPIKGKIKFSDGSVYIEGKILLGTIIFMLMWIIGWTIGGVRTPGALKYTLVGWGFLLFMLLFAT